MSDNAEANVTACAGDYVDLQTFDKRYRSWCLPGHSIGDVPVRVNLGLRKK